MANLNEQLKNLTLKDGLYYCLDKNNEPYTELCEKWHYLDGTDFYKFRFKEEIPTKILAKVPSFKEYQSLLVTRMRSR